MRKPLPVLLLLTLILANCNGQSLTEMLNGTATPTATATSTQTPIPTSTHTPQPTSTAVSAGITIPEHFVEKVIPEVGLTIGIPDDWFYLYDEKDNTSRFFVTKENIEEHGRFSTGLSVNITSEIADPALVVNNFIDSVLTEETTKEVISQDNRYLGDNQEILFRACYIAAEFETDSNDANSSINKTIIYMAIADPNRQSVYLVYFESPSSEWEDAWLNNGVFITQSVIESIDNNFLSVNNN